MIITIDNRETNRYCQAVKYYAKGNKIIIEEIPIGDFIFTDRNISVVFEYKIFYDFKNSVKEGRIFDQALRQKENFKYHFIIIELEKKGNLLELYNNTQLCEAIASLNTFTTVITCQSLSLALKIMKKQAEYCIEKHPLTKRPKEKTGNAAFNYLCLVKGVDKVKAHTICKQLNLKTFEDLRKTTTKKLTKVTGIGPITAQRIMTSIRLT